MFYIKMEQAPKLTQSIFVTFSKLTKARYTMAQSSEHGTNLTIEDLDKLERSKLFPLMIILVTVMAVGVVGNALVIVVYKLKMRRSSARVYIIALAMADLAVCIFGIPYHVLDMTFILTYTNKTVCKVFSLVMGVCTLSSVFILLVVGLDRYLKVCRPLKKQIKDFGDRKACIIAVAVAFFMSLPNGVIYGNSSVKREHFNLTGVECFIDDKYQETVFAVGYLGFSMLVFALSVLLLLFIYGLIGRKIHDRDKRFRQIQLIKERSFCICCPARNASETSLAPTGSARSDFESVSSIILKNGQILSSPICTISNGQPADCSSTSPDVMIRHRRSRSKAEERHTRKITLMMMTITIVFILAYLPFICISILVSLDTEFWKTLTPTESLIMDILLRIYLINNIVNPFVYCFWDVKFRQETVVLFRKICCGVSSQRATTLPERNTTSTSLTSSAH